MANPLKMLDLKPHGFQFIEELPVNAPPKAVWKAILNIGDWFGMNPTTGKRPKSTLEAVPGGKFITENPDGSSVLFGTVVLVEPEKLLRINGALGLTHLPVNTSFIVELQPQKDGKATLVRYCQRTFGYMDEGVQERYTQGWKQFFGVMKQNVES